MWSSEHRAVRHRRRQLRLGGNLCHTSCDELCHWARDVTASQLTDAKGKTVLWYIPELAYTATATVGAKSATGTIQLGGDETLTLRLAE